jgi:hypothetical protein
MIDQMDVVTTFLYGSLEEVIYTRQPMGFARKGNEYWVCRLLKSLYGLKQAPRQWNKRFDEFMKIRVFVRRIYNHCVYIKRVSNSIFGYVILVLYVDGMLIVAKNQSDVDQLKAQLSVEFKIKNMGKAKRILGMNIDRNIKIGKLWLTQTIY